MRLLRSEHGARRGRRRRWTRDQRGRLRLVRGRHLRRIDRRGPAGERIRRSRPARHAADRGVGRRHLLRLRDGRLPDRRDGSLAGEGTPAQVFVIDVLEVTAADEWCAIAEPGADFPTVEFSADGVPTVTVPTTEPPAEVQLEVLEEGDGDCRGVRRQRDGQLHRGQVERRHGSSTRAGRAAAPATFSTTGVVTGFQRALEGQTVGSTVAGLDAPGLRLRRGRDRGHELEGETLVFVVEIIETARPE